MQFQTSFQSQLRDPKQKRLLIVALVLLVAIGVVVWRMFFAPAASPGATSAGNTSQTTGSSAVPARGARASDLKRITLDTEIIESDMFKNLRTYSKDVPVRVTEKEKGNVDPFHQRSAPLPQPSGISPTSSFPLKTPKS